MCQHEDGVIGAADEVVDQLAELGLELRRLAVVDDQAVFFFFDQHAWHFSDFGLQALQPFVVAGEAPWLYG